jgi:hypothetical protein
MEAGHDFGGVTITPAPPIRGVADSQLDEAKVLRSKRAACGAVRADTALVGDAEKLEAMGLATHPGCRQEPACGSPGAADQLRRRADDRLAEVISADLASASPAGDQGGWAARRPTGATRLVLCCTMLILARSSQCRARRAGRVGSKAQHRQRRDRRSQRSKPATRTHRVRIAIGD